MHMHVNYVRRIEFIVDTVARLRSEKFGTRSEHNDIVSQSILLRSAQFRSIVMIIIIVYDVISCIDLAACTGKPQSENKGALIVLCACRALRNLRCQFSVSAMHALVL